MSSTTASSREVGGLKGGGGSQGEVESSPAEVPAGNSVSRDKLIQGGFRVVEGRSGDHHAIVRLLVSLFHQPSPAEFQAQIEHPLYEPNDRLLIKRGVQVVGHAQLIKREIHFGPLRLAIASVDDLCLLPEYRGQGCGTQLLAAAERRMVEDGAVLGMLRTGTPSFFQKRGWCVALRHSFSLAGSREILSYLREHEPRTRDPLKPHAPPLNIRMWRHVEQAALMRLYTENTRHSYGPLVRNDAYWRWLISRRAYDRIYVAIDGPDKIELDDALTPIVGYAVMKNERILELMTAPQCPRAGPQLLARACADAIERDLNYVRLDAAPDDPRHAVFADAGGKQTYHEAEAGEVFMVKVFDPQAFLEMLAGEMQRRAKAADLTPPLELGMLVDGAKYSLAVRRRSVKMVPGKLGRSYLECGWGELTQLMLGHLDVAAAVEAGRLQASTRVAVELAQLLFPQLPVCHPAWDTLPV